MNPKHHIVDSSATVAAKLKSSITQVSDHHLELIALGLDQARHQPTPLQNQLLAAACTALEVWVEIQKTKLERVSRSQDGGITPEGVRLWGIEGEERFIPLDPCAVAKVDGIMLGPQKPPNPEVSS